jgi:hypothetical protein
MLIMTVVVTTMSALPMMVMRELLYASARRLQAHEITTQNAYWYRCTAKLIYYSDVELVWGKQAVRYSQFGLDNHIESYKI